jgi:hypothetical protein
MTQIPQGTQLKYINLTLNNVSLQDRFNAAIRMVATSILQDVNSSSQLIKIAKNVATNAEAMTLLTGQAISYALTQGLIITSSSTLLNNENGTFDDNTVSDLTILAIVEGLAANVTLLTTLGYED